MTSCWVDVPSLKAQYSRKVNREVKVVEGLMHNLVKDSIKDQKAFVYWVTWADWG